MLSRHVLTTNETKYHIEKRPSGVMDKALASGAGNCGFMSHLEKRRKTDIINLSQLSCLLNDEMKLKQALMK